MKAQFTQSIIKTLTCSLTIFIIFTFKFTPCLSKKQLWIGAFLTVNISEGGWSSEGVLPAIQMAVEDVNNDSTVLIDYELKMNWRDTKCQRGYGVRQLVSFVSDLTHPPIMLIGGGCSIGTEATAQVSHYWNLIQIAYSANSMRLSKLESYPNLFRTCYSEAIGNPARLAILNKFGWKKVAAIYQDEGLFSLTLEDLRKHYFEPHNITLLTSESILNDPKFQVKNIKSKGARIIIGMFYANLARKVFCRAYKEGMYGGRYQWIIPGWFKARWWEDIRSDEGVECTPAQIKQAAGNYIGIMESTWSSDPGKTVSHQTASELVSRYKKLVKPSLENEYCVFGYDAVWAVALTLNKSIETLRAQGKFIDQFQYNDTNMANIFKKNLYSLKYKGMSGDIRFDKFGDRIGIVVVEQLQGDVEVKVGEYNSSSDTIRMNEEQMQWIDGSPPADHTQVEVKLKAISMGLFIFVSSLATVGILMSTGFLVFNVYHRKKRFIRMSSPRLNSLIIIGSIFVYTSVIISGLDGKFLAESQYTTSCQVQVWTFCVGFTLAYGAMFSKTWRVHILFMKKLERRSIKDHQLLAMVAGLLLIDVILLTTWQVVDPPHYAIEYQPLVEEGEDGVLKTYVEHCRSENYMLWQGVILVYKGLLLLFGAFLAWETRKVTIPALNDSKNIALSVYTVVLTCIIGLPVLIFVKSMQDFSYGLNAAICLLCTSVALCLLFVPKILVLGKKDIEESSVNQTIRNTVVPLSTISNAIQEMHKTTDNCNEHQQIANRSKSLDVLSFGDVNEKSGSSTGADGCELPRTRLISISPNNCAQQG